VILLQGSDSHEPVEILNDMAFRIRIVWLLEGPIHEPVEILNDVATRIEILSLLEG
jgi:hypothetical protein